MPNSASPPRPGAAAGPSGIRRELDVFASLRSHWLACLVIFAIVGGALAQFAIGAERVVYTSTAALRVARTFPRTLQQDRELELSSSYDYDSFRNDQVALLLRSDVLHDALARAGQEGPPWAPAGASAADQAQGFARSLTVTVVPKSTRIEIELRSTDRTVLQPALSALLAAFEDAHRREYFFSQDERPETLREALAQVEASIAAKRKEIDGLARELGVTNFAEGTANPWTLSLESARTALAAARRNLSRVQVRRDAAVNAAQEDLTPERILAGGSGWTELNDSLRLALTPLAERHRALSSQLAAIGADHPGRKALESELAELERTVTGVHQRQVSGLLLAIETELLEALAESELLQSQVADLESNHDHFVAAFQRGRIVEDELPRDLNLRDRLNQRLEFFVFEGKSPSYAEVVQQADEPDPRGDSDLKRNLALALAFALMLALGLPILWDLRDDLVHTPADVARSLGFTPVGWMPRAARLGSRKLHTNQAQRFALALDRDRKRHGARLIVFTGVKSRHTMELVRAVATAMRSLERRTLVVDATASEYDAYPESSGLIGLLLGEPLQTVPIGSAGEMLPWGRVEDGSPYWDAWPRALLDSAGDYDVILVAGPSLLGSPASELLVEGADLAVVVVEAERERLGEVHRAAQLLQALKPRALGSVLTNVRPFRSRGYYRQLG